MMVCKRWESAIDPESTIWVPEYKLNEAVDWAIRNHNMPLLKWVIRKGGDLISDLSGLQDACLDGENFEAMEWLLLVAKDLSVYFMTDYSLEVAAKSKSLSFLQRLVKTCYGSAALEEDHVAASCGSRDWKKAHWIHTQVCRNHGKLNGCQRMWCLKRAVNSKDLPTVMWLRELYQDTREYYMSVSTLVKRDFVRWGYVMSASVRKWVDRELTKALPCDEYRKMCTYINT